MDEALRALAGVNIEEEDDEDYNSLDDEEEDEPLDDENDEPELEAGLSKTAKKDSTQFLDIDKSPIDIDDGDQGETEDEIVIPAERERDSSYLGLILNPNLRDLELYIRGLEYVKSYDPRRKKEVIRVRRVKSHFLNERGINAILQELKVHTSSDMTLQRVDIETYRIKTHEVGQTFHRLIYKNLKEFGMETHEEQRHARRLWLAIKNKIDAAYSRAIDGKENDLSRARIELHGEIGGLGEDVPYFSKNGNPQSQQNKRMEQMRT